jgi:hypothetical protein
VGALHVALSGGHSGSPTAANRALPLSSRGGGDCGFSSLPFVSYFASQVLMFCIFYDDEVDGIRRDPCDESIDH